jgi:hypothetical protein
MPKFLNTAMLREVHHIPTIEELSIELNGAKMISKLDLNSAYNQLGHNGVFNTYRFI